MAAGMGREEEMTCLPIAKQHNLTVGSLYKLVVLPPEYRSSLYKFYKYTSLVYLHFKHEVCVSYQHRLISTHEEIFLDYII